MSKAAKRPSSKNKLLKKASFSKAQLIAFAIIFASIGGYAIYRSFAAAANVYVSTTGNDSTCIRGDQIKPCASFNKAYQIAQPGDNVQVAPGTYASQTIQRGGQSQSGPMITLTGGTGVTVNGDVTLGVNNGSASGDTPNYLTLDGINIKNGLLSTYYNGNSVASEPQSNHLVIENAHIQCTNGCSGHLIALNSSDNVTVKNMELGPQCCDGDAVELAIPRDGAPNPSNIILDKLYIHDLYDTCNNMPAALKSQASCSGTGFGDGCTSCDHVDGIQGFAGDNITVSNSRIYSVNPNSSSSTGAAQGIFFSPVRGTYSNLSFINNMLTCGCGTNTFSISGPGTNVVSGYVKFLYNSVDGNGIQIYDTTNSQILAPGTQVIYAGNINTGGFIHNYPGSSCSFTAGNGSSITPIFKNNLWASQSCDPSDRSGSPSWVNENFYSPDLHFSTGSQAAVNSGESTYCPATDIDGDSRPQGSACDIGADEIISTGGTPTPIPGDLNSDGHVTITDLSILLSNYATTNTTADINHDGTVNILDLSILLSNYGKSSSPATTEIASEATCPNQSNNSVSDSIKYAAMICMTSNARNFNGGLGPVAQNSVLTSAAQSKIDDMLACNDISHTACGRVFDYWISFYHYSGNCWGENFAWGYPTVHDTFVAWMNSAPHRANILNAGYSDIGLNWRATPNNGALWVMELGGCR